MGETATVDAAPQHLRALEHANRVRLARAELKRRVASQDLNAVQVVLECPWQAESMSISDLLMSQRRWGRARCRRLLLSIGIPENKQIGSFTERQRAALAGMLAGIPPSQQERPPRHAGAQGGMEPDGCFELVARRAREAAAMAG